MGEAENLIAAEHRRRAAMRAGDMEALDELLGDPFHYAHISGLVDDRAGYLGRIGSGQVIYPFTEAKDLQVQIRPGYALLTGISVLGFEWTDGGAKGEFTTLFTSVWEPVEGSWQMTAYASTPMPDG